ncbi:hypothetical protein SERLA73DRAFT_179371 [Serpula lacrymans var. lacrymans S7.3]|uniref:Uncharacterized protein n=1 Tax=Serpula lacrymans var. lacrymans (strain S7.3) TaxID=936435 RepID=F8PS57_SERL3|nr:hypothetical protein SERLA73DRAFT_179371 [Serpula lacrymans var. lacrymans S7.3]
MSINRGVRSDSCTQSGENEATEIRCSRTLGIGRWDREIVVCTVPLAGETWLLFKKEPKNIMRGAKSLLEVATYAMSPIDKVSSESLDVYLLEHHRPVKMSLTQTTAHTLYDHVRAVVPIITAGLPRGAI